MEKKQCMNFDAKTFCLITGASRGFGRSIATIFAKSCNFEQGSVMVLSGRNESGLKETKEQVEKLNNIIKVYTEVWDLENLECLENFTSKIFNLSHDKFDAAILVNNAGTLGDVSKKITSPMPHEYYRKHLDVNVISVFLLIQQFFKAFEAILDKLLIVNITSLCAIQEMPYMSLYCASRAAREMLHKALACEEKKVRVLNYSPGPMETEMSMDIQQNCGNEASRDFFRELRESKKIVDPGDSAERMMKLLREDNYKSGDHIDYYDVV
eukprot:gene7231-8039_t